MPAGLELLDDNGLPIFDLTDYTYRDAGGFTTSVISAPTVITAPLTAQSEVVVINNSGDVYSGTPIPRIILDRTTGLIRVESSWDFNIGLRVLEL